MIFDFDQHLFEYPNMWLDHCDPDKKELALEMTRDELGYPWLWSRATNQLMYIYSKTVPEDGFESFFGPWQRWKDRIPAEVDYVADMPAACTEPKARVEQLDQLGVDKSILFPHFGAVWGRYVHDRLDILRANMTAWNRWAVTVREEGSGRLEPTGHVTLRGGDLGWLESELAYLGKHGIKAAFLSYGLVDGRRMSHPDHDRAWRAFLNNGIVPVFHIQDADVRASGLDEGWFIDAADPLFAALDMAFSHLGVQVAAADLILNGVFDKFPDLRFATVELTAGWINPLIGLTEGIPGSTGAVVNGPGLDASYAYERVARRHSVHLKRSPSEYLRDHFRSTVHPMEPIKSYVETGLGNNLMFGSDWPHSEGFNTPLTTFRSAVGDLSPEQDARFFGGTAAELLGVS
ncbi:amidohydrolase family protein [Mycobacterium camsae]|uniref:amidohydrolase family protein n=1 Tax=Mycobacterium gordonae TaxID=1778 RepID=UPI00197E56DA|nr:amidohydrolase family protein [Mycobacterium gordonae]